MCTSGFPCAAVSTGLVVGVAPAAFYVQGTTMLPTRELVVALDNATGQALMPMEVRSARGEALPGTDWGEMGAFLLLLTAFVGVTTSFATWSFRSYQRTL